MDTIAAGLLLLYGLLEIRDAIRAQTAVLAAQETDAEDEPIQS